MSEDFDVESLAQSVSLPHNADCSLGSNDSSWSWDISNDSLHHAAVNIGRFPNKNIGETYPKDR